MQDSSMSETTALHTQQLSWKQPMHSTLLLFFLLLLHLFTCQEFQKSQRFSTLTQEEVGAPPHRHEVMAVIPVSCAAFTGRAAKKCDRCRMWHHTASKMSLGMVHRGQTWSSPLSVCPEANDTSCLHSSYYLKYYTPGRTLMHRFIQ